MDNKLGNLKVQSVAQNKFGHCLLISTDKVIAPDKDDKTVAHCLTLPGKTLHLTPLLNQKKFRGYGNKEAAVRAFFKLEEEGLGKTLIIGPSRVNPVSINVQYEFAVTYIYYAIVHAAV